jgi:hypothetical protein
MTLQLASASMYLDASGNVVQGLSPHGYLAVGLAAPDRRDGAGTRQSCWALGY